MDEHASATAALGALDARVLERVPVPDEDVEGALARARTFHEALEARLGVLQLTLTDNVQRMVTAREAEGQRELRVHWMFVWCDEATARALIAFLEGDVAASKVVRAFVAQRRDWLYVTPEQEELRACGEVHDLVALLDLVRAEHLPHAELEDVVITWGRRGRGKRKIRLGSFDFDRRLIRVHPALDQPWVPSFFVEYIIYHELLHGLYPPERDDEGRRALHHEAFREREQDFPRYDEALAWEAAHLHRLFEPA